MLRRQALAVGWGGSPPRCDGVWVRSVALDDLPAAVRAASHGVVAILADPVLRSCPPEDLAAEVPHPRCRLVGVLDGRDDALVARWARATDITFTTRAGLANLVLAELEMPLRPVVPLEAWLPARLLRLLRSAHGPRPTAHGPRPTASGGPFEEVFSLVPILPSFTVIEWEKALGRRPRWLSRLLGRFTLLTPSDLIWRHVRALAFACRRRGDSPDETALCCGYSDRAGLYRAFRRRQCALPGRGRNGRAVSRKDTNLYRSATTQRGAIRP